MRFIRKNGRVIPIQDPQGRSLRERVASGAERGAIPGAAIVGGLVGLVRAASEKKAIMRFNPVEMGFWGLKGAIAGGVAGGLLGAAHVGSKVKPATKMEEVTKAFKRSGTLAAIATTTRLAAPFLPTSEVRWASKIAATGLYLASIGSAYHSSMKASEGNKGRVLAAGAIGSVAGTNLLRLGRPMVRNRYRLGLRRI